MAYDNRTIVLLLLNIKKRSCGEKYKEGLFWLFPGD